MKMTSQKLENHRKWHADYDRYRASEQTQVKFAREAGIKLVTFKSRIQTIKKQWKLSKETKANKAVKRSEDGFVPVVLRQPSESSNSSDEPYCVVTFRESGRIIVESVEAMDAFSKLIQIKL